MTSKRKIRSKYNKDELYDLWLNFRTSPDSVVILADFMLGTKQQAEELIKEFEIRQESSMLDCVANRSNRRYRKNI